NKGRRETKVFGRGSIDHYEVTITETGKSTGLPCTRTGASFATDLARERRRPRRAADRQRQRRGRTTEFETLLRFGSTVGRACARVLRRIFSFGKPFACLGTQRACNDTQAPTGQQPMIPANSGNSNLAMVSTATATAIVIADMIG